MLLYKTLSAIEIRVTSRPKKMIRKLTLMHEGTTHAI